MTFTLTKKENEDELPFQGSDARLEVSGILNGTNGEINARVKEKLDQISKSDSSLLPAFVVVVEFSRPLAKMVKKNESS